MREHTTPEPEMVRVDSNLEEIVDELLEHQGVHGFVVMGEHVLDGSDIALNTHLARVTMRMKESATFKDGIKTGFGVLSTFNMFEISGETIEQHIQDFNSFRKEGEYLHEAAVRLGFKTIQSDPGMTVCAAKMLPRFGYANEIVFTSGIGYAELLAELAARESFDATSAQMLDAEFGEAFSDAEGLMRGFDVN